MHKVLVVRRSLVFLSDVDCNAEALLRLVAEFMSSPESVNFQFYRGLWYPKKCKVYSFSY